MKRSSLNPFLFFLPFLLFFFTFNLFQYFADFYSFRLAEAVSRSLGPDVKVERVWISPLEGVRLTGIRFHDHLGQVFSVREVILKGSPKELLRGKISFKKIFINDAKARIWQGQEISSLNYFSQLGKSKNKGKKDLSAVFKGAKVCFNKMYIHVSDEKGYPASKDIVLDFCLDQAGNKVHCDGRLNYAKIAWLDETIGPQEFSLRDISFLTELDFAGSDILVNQMKIFTPKYTFAGSGVIRDFERRPKADIRIHAESARLEKAEILKPFRPQGGELGIIGQLTGEPGNLTLSAELLIPTVELALQNDTLSLDRVSCAVVYSSRDHSLVLKGLRGIMDGTIRFLATGEIAHLTSPFVKLRFEMTEIDAEKQAVKNSGMVLTLQGERAGANFKGDASFLLTDFNGRQYFYSLSDFSFGTKSAAEGTFMLAGEALDFSEIALENGEKKKMQEFHFNNILSDIRFVGKKTFIDSFSAEAYGGRLLLRGYTYFNRNVRHSRFLIGMEHLGLKDIKITYPVPFKMSGMVSGDIDIKTNKSNVDVKGIVTASGLDLSGLELLDNVADFIGIKSIKEINGADFAVGFDLSPEKSVIEQFDLDSPEMSIRSNFRIDQKQWLEGEIALGLPRKILEESKIFKKLIAMARERQHFLDFVVHLSGYSWQLRTELVKSDFRDKLREKTAAWIQNRIEREVNKAIEEQGD